MITVHSLPLQGTAYQYLPETASSLSELQLPTGPVTVQFADELNRIEGRCYVPTSWGTAILSPGDWIVVYDVGIVVTVTAEQFPHLYSTQPISEEEPPEEMPEEPIEEPIEELGEDLEGKVVPVEARTMSLDTDIQAIGKQQLRASATPIGATPVLQFRATEDSYEWLASFEAYCFRYRLDFAIYPIEGSSQFVIRVVATNREVVTFHIGDLLDCYADGHIELVSEATSL